MFIIFFFFKQKTAYYMRISDWSSDVCSSDLAVPRGGQWLGPFCATAPILLLLLLFPAGISFAGREVIAAAPMLSSRIDEAVASGGRRLLGFLVANPCQLETLLREVIGPVAQESEERRVGKGCVRTCRSRWSP